MCPLCDEYPCALIENYNKVYPITIEDGKRLKEIGLEGTVPEFPSLFVLPLFMTVTLLAIMTYKKKRAGF